MRRAHAMMAGAGLIAALGAACNALNGVDDLIPVDGFDGAAPDTAAPPATCACAASAPDGWTGPVAIVEAAGARASCPPGTASVFQGHADLSAPTSCAPCSCGPPQGPACDALGITVHGNGACTGLCSGQLATTTCAKAKYCAPGEAAILDAEAAFPDAATCTPTGGELAPAIWARTAAACALDTDGGACPRDQTCSVGNTAACIFRAGDLPCPPGPYASRRMYYTSIRDQRSCAPCACDAPVGAQCTGGAVTLYADTACATAVTTVTLGEACKSFAVVQAAGGAMITTPAVLDGGACAPKGGDAGGSGASPDQPATVCCAAP